MYVKVSRAFALAAKIAGLLSYGAFALRGFCPTTEFYVVLYTFLRYTFIMCPVSQV